MADVKTYKATIEFSCPFLDNPNMFPRFTDKLIHVIEHIQNADYHRCVIHIDEVKP